MVLYALKVIIIIKYSFIQNVTQKLRYFHWTVKPFEQD